MIDPKQIEEWKRAAEQANAHAGHEDAEELDALAVCLGAVPALIAEVERLGEMARSADRVLAWCLRRDPLASPACDWRIRYAALTGRPAPERHYAPDEREEMVPRAEVERLQDAVKGASSDLSVLRDVLDEYELPPGVSLETVSDLVDRATGRLAAALTGEDSTK